MQILPEVGCCSSGTALQRLTIGSRYQKFDVRPNSRIKVQLDTTTNKYGPPQVPRCDGKCPRRDESGRLWPARIERTAATAEVGRVRTDRGGPERAGRSAGERSRGRGRRHGRQQRCRRGCGRIARTRRRRSRGQRPWCRRPREQRFLRGRAPWRARTRDLARGGRRRRLAGQPPESARDVSGRHPRGGLRPRRWAHRRRGQPPGCRTAGQLGRADGERRRGRAGPLGTRPPRGLVPRRCQPPGRERRPRPGLVGRRSERRRERRPVRDRRKVESRAPIEHVGLSRRDDALQTQHGFRTHVRRRLL